MSTQSTLEGFPREGTGKGPARRTRQAGKVPAVVYGKHLDKPFNISVDPIEVKKAVQTKRKLNTLIALKVGAKTSTVLLKEYQMDPVTRAMLHVDFIEVRETEEVKVKVPVVLVGKAIGTADGGLLTQMRRELEVFALPAAIPDQLEIDVTPLKIGAALHINDVKLPAGLKVKSNVNYTLAVVVAPEAEVKVEVAAVAEGAAAPAADGKAPAADAKAGDAKAGDAKAGDAKAAPAAAAKKK